MKELTQTIMRNLFGASAGHGDVYAILDTARDEKIFPRLGKAPEGSRCLYEGEIPRPLAETAPYLMKVLPWHSFTETLIDDGWGQSWGIFLSSPAPLPEVRRHLRRFLMVQDEEGRSLYFRYYDPRVFRAYLPTCNEEELKMIFGPVEQFWCEAPDGRGILEYGRKEGALKQREWPLGKGAPPC